MNIITFKDSDKFVFMIDPSMSCMDKFKWWMKVRYYMLKPFYSILVYFGAMIALCVCGNPRCKKAVGWWNN